MAQRTTTTKIKLQLTADYDIAGAPSLQPFLAAAVALTDRAVACAVAKGISLTASVVTDAETTTLAALIENALACHFYKYARDRELMSKSTAGASGSYSGQTAMYLEGTRYGQTALSLDVSGCLQAIAMGQQAKRARGRWLGRRPSEQTAYTDRN